LARLRSSNADTSRKPRKTKTNSRVARVSVTLSSSVDRMFKELGHWIELSNLNWLLNQKTLFQIALRRVEAPFIWVHCFHAYVSFNLRQHYCSASRYSLWITCNLLFLPLNFCHDHSLPHSVSWQLCF
jgi:hypothetical protein